MQRYETIVIVAPDLSDEQHEPIFNRITELIPQHDGLLVKIENWGIKKLAYEIKKKARGYYSRIDYCGSGPLVDEIERFFRIDDRVLKYMTVLLEKQVDMVSIQAEIAEADAVKEQSAQAAAPEAASEATPEAASEATPEAASEATPEAAFEATPEAEQPPVKAAETEAKKDEADVIENNKEEI
ncbi:30S ribosomal protein S6 [Thermodesulfobacteriota bacterium]